MRTSPGVVSPAGGTHPTPRGHAPGSGAPKAPLISALSVLQKHFSLYALGSAWPRLPGAVDVMEGEVAYGNMVNALSEFQDSKEGGEEDTPITEKDVQQGPYLRGAYISHG